ncbi:MAG TPA: thioredoxin domain-containing protein [Gemmatimonadaceae bacterium]
MANRLAHETSPYLLQHANNPVDWYPWGPEALERARREDKPILLSIGYSACHWCHVMEHESFENGETARLMNEHFVNIKVDREERPDLDGIYMQAVQAMTGHGGWPMTVFLTPDGVPYYSGTYFPNTDHPGMPSFRRVLMAVSNAYANRKTDVTKTTDALREMYAATAEETRSSGPLSAEMLDRAYSAITPHYDKQHGGFGGAPKFPQPMTLEFLLTYWARGGPREALEMVLHSFQRMVRGGIYDQVGGGFARYTVDAIWLVPHFEKMLYDNALLARLGVHVWQATGDASARRAVEETVTWVQREMTSPEGGFYSSLDADSEGHEGKFYVWSVAELDEALGGDAPVMKALWGVSESGNFEGRNILSVAGERAAITAQFDISESQLDEIVTRARARLLLARSRRGRPGCDDKVLAAWNGLMLRAVAEAARAFDSGTMRAMAQRNADFLFGTLVTDGRVLRSYRAGTARIAGYLDDYAALGLAALAMYEMTFDSAWLDRARTLADSMVQWFWDDVTGAFYDTATDQERLIARPRDATDNALPSGTSLAIELLTRLAELLHDVDARRRATYVVETLAPTMTRHPTAFGHALGVADLLVHGAIELAIVGDSTSRAFHALARVAAERYLPNLVLAGGSDGRVALLQDRPMREGRATAYVCRNYACDEPATGPEQLADQLDRLVPRG